MMLPLRLRHLLAVLVAHQRVDVDGAERHVAHEMQAHHHHPGDPEEDDVEAGDQDVGRVVARELRRLLRPAEGRERPQRRGEPGVEHVLVALELRPRGRNALAAAACASASRLRDEDAAVGPVPGRDLVAPPELARDAPGLDVAHPFEERVLPLPRHEHGAARPRPPRSPAAASVLASQYHWSVSHGSITTPERSP